MKTLTITKIQNKRIYNESSSSFNNKENKKKDTSSSNKKENKLKVNHGNKETDNTATLTSKGKEPEDDSHYNYSDEQIDDLSSDLQSISVSNNNKYTNKPDDSIENDFIYLILI